MDGITKQKINTKSNFSNRKKKQLNPSIKHSTQQQQNKHFSEVHMKHSQRQTTWWAIKQSSVNLETKIMKTTFSDHNGVKVEINNIRKFEGFTNIWKSNSTF